MWIIGVDGGGTKCKAGLFDQNGRLLASSQTGSANLFADFNSAIKHIDDACREVINSANTHLNMNIISQECFLSLGCAGAGIDSVKAQFKTWRHDYNDAALTTDIHISCLAANNQQDCALVITGTGSCVAIYQNCELKQYGGHGFLLGDLGSGAWLGKLAITWYLQALETPTVELDLQAAMAEQLGDNVNAIVQEYGHACSANFARLVPSLLSVQDSSPQVKAWLSQGLDYLSQILEVHAQADTDIFIDGGIAHIYQQGLSQRLKRPVARPHFDAITGAFAYAQMLADKGPRSA